VSNCDCVNAEDEIGGTCGTHKRQENTYHTGLLVGQSELQKSAGCLSFRYEENIKIGRRGVRCEFVHWTRMAQKEY